MTQENPIEWPIESKSAKDNLLKVLRNRRWWSREGEFVKRFQQGFREFVNVKHVLCCSNGTVALEIALKSLDIGFLDYVIVPNLTFIGTATAVLRVGGIPVFADVNLETACIDLNSIQEIYAKYPDRIKAIILVHLGGQCCDLNSIVAWANKEEIPVIEDCAQAVGAKYNNKHVGTFGDIGCFSFQNSKNITSGEGGAIVTDSKDLAIKINKLIDYNYDESEQGTKFEYLSGNGRLSEFQGAVLVSQLEVFPAIQAKREENYSYLLDLFSGIQGLSFFKKSEGMTNHGCYLFMMRYKKEYFNNRPKSYFIKYLQNNGIPCWGGYEHLPLDRFPFFQKNLFLTKDSLWSALYKKFNFVLPEQIECPNSYVLAEEFVWIPQFVLLREKESLGKISQVMNDFNNINH